MGLAVAQMVINSRWSEFAGFCSSSHLFTKNVLKDGLCHGPRVLCCHDFILISRSFWRLFFLIIIVLEFPPLELETQCVCVCVCVCAVDDIACIQASLWWSTVSTGWHVSVYVCECVCICFSHHPRLYLQQWCWRRRLKLCSLII